MRLFSSDLLETGVQTGQGAAGKSGGRGRWSVKGGVGLLLALAAFTGHLCAQTDPDAAEAKRLVTKIRKQMRVIDEALLAARDPQQAARVLERNIKDIEDLLRSVEERQSQCIKDIDELVDLAKYRQQQRQQQSQSSQSSSKKPDQDEQARREKSQDPRELSQQPASERNDQKKPEGGDRPDQPRQEEASDAPPPGDTDRYQRTDLSDRWGVLPAKEAEDLINADLSKFPERYRRWLDAYYRRVNERRR